MMSEGGKAPIDTITHQEDIQVRLYSYKILSLISDYRKCKGGWLDQ